MSTTDEIRQMQQQGISEEEIIRVLREKGTPYKDISQSLEQTKIRAAVEAPTSPGSPIDNSAPPLSSQDVISPQQTAEQDYSIMPPGRPQGMQQEPQQEALPGMQQSMMKEELPAPEPMDEGREEEYQEQKSLPDPAAEEPVEEYGPEYEEQYPQETGGDYGYQEYQPYDYQTTAVGISPDTITEISEQVVAERMTEMRKQLERTLDLKTQMESKIEFIEERIKHIEKIIDSLQSSVLRKVGDYVTNVADIKKELIQTQKKHLQN